MFDSIIELVSLGLVNEVVCWMRDSPLFALGQWGFGRLFLYFLVRERHRQSGRLHFLTLELIRAELLVIIAGAFEAEVAEL